MVMGICAPTRLQVSLGWCGWRREWCREPRDDDGLSYCLSRSSRKNKVMGHLLIQFVEFEQIFLIFLPKGLERSGNRQNVHFQVLKLNWLRNSY